MKKLFHWFLLFYTILVVIQVSGCDSRNSAKPVADFSPTSTDTTEDDIRQQKPKFLDFTPVTYHLVNTGDHNYIRIITNSGELQKVWMVYYDHNGKNWKTLTWSGKGLNNTIIADTFFNTVFGVVNRTGHIEDPTFYMAYSKDEGKTWVGHTIEKAILNCKGKGAGINHVAELLLSNDFINRNGRPSLVVIVQSPVAAQLESSKATENWDNSYLCPMMGDMKIKP